MLHGLMGLTAELLGIYLVLRMNDLIPERWRVKNFKLVMRTTLALWLLTAVVGIGVYLVLYARTAEVKAPVTASETPVPTLVAQLSPTAEPPHHTPTSPGPTETLIGSAAVRDNLNYGDQVFVNLTNLSAPKPGQVYAGWLTGASGALRRPIGKIPLDADGNAQFSFDAAKGENLTAQYDGFLLTLEPENIPNVPSGPVVASAQLPPNAMVHIRHLLVSFPGTPGKIGLDVGLRQQTEELLRHAQFARDALRANDLAGVKRHTEHMILLIEGKKGPDYKDLDRDGKVLDPGDGFGLLNYGDQLGYLKGVADHAGLAAEADDATDLVKLHSRHVQIATENITGWVTQLRDIGLTVFASKDVASTGDKVQQMLVLAERAYNGFDANNNEVVEPIPGEAGAKLAYQHAQLMAQMPLLIQQAAQPAPTVAAAAVPTLVPEPTSTPTLSPPAPNTLTVLMVNFNFEPQNITVKVGTTVTFVNQDKAPHTVTADGQEFDTGTIEPNNSAQITFNKPGTFKFFCDFHGGPGGQGMSGTITVQP
jgi:plastocyanin